MPETLDKVSAPSQYRSAGDPPTFKYCKKAYLTLVDRSPTFQF